MKVLVVALVCMLDRELRFGRSAAAFLSWRGLLRWTRRVRGAWNGFRFPVYRTPSVGCGYVHRADEPSRSPCAVARVTPKADGILARRGGIVQTPQPLDGGGDFLPKDAEGQTRANLARRLSATTSLESSPNCVGNRPLAEALHCGPQRLTAK